MNPWTWAVSKVTPAPAWARGPVKTSITHAGITVLGLMPWPVGPFAIAYFMWTTHSWAWLASSGITLVWYWLREYRTTGLKPKKGLRYVTVGSDIKVTTYTFWQRWDTWMDVLLPTFAYGLQLGLLGWLI